MNKLKQNKGITLIALVITIIVMLILVAVTINMAVNGGLFGYAGNAARETEAKKAAEEDYTTLEANLSTNDLIEKYTTYGMTFTAYTVGQTITISGENFYVIEDSDETKGTVKLLAAQNVDTTTNKQSPSAGTVAFDSTQPYTNDYNVSGCTIKGLVDSYVASLEVNGVQGRLLLASEAEELIEEHSDIICTTEYWLGTPVGTMGDMPLADHVDGRKGMGGGPVGVANASSFGLRPVIVIPKANIH